MIIEGWFPCLVFAAMVAACMSMVFEGGNNYDA